MTETETRLTQAQSFSGPDNNAINATELIQMSWQRARNTELKLSNIRGVEEYGCLGQPNDGLWNFREIISGRPFVRPWVKLRAKKELFHCRTTACKKKKKTNKKKYYAPECRKTIVLCQP